MMIIIIIIIIVIIIIIIIIITICIRQICNMGYGKFVTFLQICYNPLSFLIRMFQQAAIT